MLRASWATSARLSPWLRNVGQSLHDALHPSALCSHAICLDPLGSRVACARLLHMPVSFHECGESAMSFGERSHCRIRALPAFSHFQIPRVLRHLFHSWSRWLSALPISVSVPRFCPISIHAACQTRTVQLKFLITEGIDSERETVSGQPARPAASRNGTGASPPSLS